MNHKQHNKFQEAKTTVFRVDREDTLMPFLIRKFGSMSKTGVKKILSEGFVSIDGQQVTNFDYNLKTGMEVVIRKESDNERFRNPWVKIVYQDDDIFVIEKRNGILSNSANAKDETVQRILNTYLDRTHQRCSSHVIHRLDRDTSGLMVFAKSKKVALAFEEDWKNIVYDRRYVAMVHGEMVEKTGTVTSYLRENSHFLTISSKEDNGGKLAITHYNVLKVADGFSLVELKLETGRKNQIRVHMQDLGFPVVGDAKYGDGTNPIGRLGLHAYRLCFRHPVTGEDMVFETAMPKWA